MKLLHCERCNDIVALLRKRRACFCGASAGKYVNDKGVVVTGAARVLGMKNPEILRSIPGPNYGWWVIRFGDHVRWVGKVPEDEPETSISEMKP